MPEVNSSDPYPVRLSVDYPEHLSRIKTIFRPILIIPIYVLLAILVGQFEFWIPQDDSPFHHSESRRFGSPLSTIFASFFMATALMILFRKKYPYWWFDFIFALTKFVGRVSAYCLLLMDTYPSTEDDQAYHLEMDYPYVDELSRWLPLVKWFLAIPHYFVLMFLSIGLVISVVLAWFAILVMGRYPKALFNYVVGTHRWWVRVNAYAFLLVTDRYPPFSLK